ncbi:MAG: hypothetical protein RLY31_1813 [Bacteroidota bacterium]
MNILWCAAAFILPLLEKAGGHLAGEAVYPEDCQKTYAVRRCDEAPQIDGHADPAEWSSALVLTDFSLPWESVTAPLTIFLALHDRDYLYFCYVVADTNLVLWNHVDEEMDIVYEDRVELFFAADRELDAYYCFEIDALGRALDNSGRLGMPIEPDWNCPGSLLKGMVREDGYTVEGRIPLASLAEMGVYRPGEPILTGLYRAEFNGTGHPRSPDMHWISWIRPDSEKPNFHIPSSFGCLVLE